MSKPTYEELEATLERVRAVLKDFPNYGCRSAVEAALASQPEEHIQTRQVRPRQPEAQVKHKTWCAQMTMVARKCDCLPQELKDAAALASQPEVPKDDYEPSAQTMAVMGWTPRRCASTGAR